MDWLYPLADWLMYLICESQKYHVFNRPCAAGHHCFGTNWGQCQEILPVVSNLTTLVGIPYNLVGNLYTKPKKIYLR